MTTLEDNQTLDPQSGFRRWTRSRLGMAGGVVLFLMVLACLGSMPYTMGTVEVGDASGGAAQASQPRYNSQSLDAFLLPPSWTPHNEKQQVRLDTLDGAWFWFGTDQLGRSELIRCAAGGAVSLAIGLAAATIAVVIGTLYGMIAGFKGGRVDAFMMRIVDVLYGLPYILLVVLLAVALGGIIDRLDVAAVERMAARAAEGITGEQPGFLLNLIRNHAGLLNVLTLLVAIGGVSWLTMARVIRGQVLSLKKQPFMESARAIGVPVRRQLLRHILPNLMGPIIVYATLTVPQAILQESFLSFLGIGVQPPLPSWGNLAADGLNQLNPVVSRWWLLLWPCLLLGTTLLALNFLGEGLRESMDPKRRQV